ncbi:MAG: FAD-binding protein [Chloroflexi bacterium]|nr:FAD-binding protein [Chloroflexota bacterium]
MSNRTYDVQADVVVIGYGAAGAASAITAHDNGASVILLEKMREGGGNSRVFGGNIAIASSMEFADYLDKITFGSTDRETIQTFVEGNLKLKDWIAKLGGELQPFVALKVLYPATKSKGDVSFPGLRGSETVRRYNLKGPEECPCDRMWRLISSNVERRAIKVLTGMPARDLIKSQQGEVEGVIAESEGKTLAIKARKGVILCCGGFENDEAMKFDCLGVKHIKFVGNPGNTGDGIRMAQKVGAGMWHLNRSATNIGFQAPGFEAAFYIFFSDVGFLYVDQLGRRFLNETYADPYEYASVLSNFDDREFRYPRIPFYAVMDEAVMRAGRLAYGTAGYNKNLYRWSLDNKAEVDKGWITRSRNLSELAKQIAVAESALANTVNTYNSYCGALKDPDFGRAKENLKEIHPPFYAIKLWPTILNTQGGPRRDKEARVLDPDGKPIPRLYSAGEIGSIWGFRYQTATNMAECLVFGQIAGRNASNNSAIVD